MQPIRVITAELPRLLQEIVAAVLASAGGVQMVGQAATQAELLELSRRCRPDLVILAMDTGDRPPFGWDLFAADPQLRVLGIAMDGRHASVYELRPHRVAIGELSVDTLVAAVRGIPAARAASGFDGFSE